MIFNCFSNITNSIHFDHIVANAMIAIDSSPADTNPLNLGIPDDFEAVGLAVDAVPPPAPPSLINALASHFTHMCAEVANAVVLLLPVQSAFAEYVTVSNLSPTQSLYITLVVAGLPPIPTHWSNTTSLHIKSSLWQSCPCWMAPYAANSQSVDASQLWCVILLLSISS